MYSQSEKMIGKVVLSRQYMFVLKFAERILEFVFQGRSPKIIQVEISFVEADFTEICDGPLYEFTVDMEIEYNGVVIKTKTTIDACYDPKNPHAKKDAGWGVIRRMIFEITSIKSLSGVHIHFNFYLAFNHDALVLNAWDEETANIRKIWKELGLETTAEIRTRL